MLIILFGLSASGKSYVGKTAANHFPFYFWDADTVMPDDMKKSIIDKQVFTQEMRDRFTDIVINKISILQEDHSNLIIAQAFYKEKNRLQIRERFPDAKFILIDAHPHHILSRLKKRNDWVDEDYASKMRANFENPSLTHSIIENNADEHSIVNQFKKIISQQP